MPAIVSVLFILKHSLSSKTENILNIWNMYVVLTEVAIFKIERRIDINDLIFIIQRVSLY